MTTRGHKGRFRPKNPGKYKGDPSNIIYRSLWEFKFFRYVDLHPDIIWWQSEEVIVPYYSPIDGKRHRYFPDVFKVEILQIMMVQVVYLFMVILLMTKILTLNMIILVLYQWLIMDLIPIIHNFL